jgi:GAF domain-containing protein/HAMP domain-containing protein
MGIVVDSNIEPSAKGFPVNSTEINRAELTLQIGIVTTVACILLTLASVIYAITRPDWVHVALAIMQIVGCVIAGISIRPTIQRTSVRVDLLIVAIAVMMTGMSLFVDSLSIPAALIVLAYTIILTSVSVTGETAERSLSLGIVDAWLVSVLGFLTPFATIVLITTNTITTILLGTLVIIYLTLLAMGYVTATLRLRLILGGLSIVLMPLIVLSIVQSMMTQTATTQRIQDALSSAARQTAFRMDDLLASNRNTISRDSTLPILAKYLALQPDRRPASQEEKDLIITFQALQKRPQQYLISYGLLDFLGVVVYDINSDEVGKFEGISDYYAEALQGKNYISNIQFSEKDGRPYLYFASPVYGENNLISGVMRAKYDANLFQYMLNESTNLVGPNTYPILLDENFLRLGDMYTPRNLYMTLAPLPPIQVLYLRSLNRLPVNEAESATNLNQLVNTLRDRPEETFLSTELNPDDLSDGEQELVSISRLNNKPWIVLYTQETRDMINLTTAQQRSASLIAVILAGFVTIFTTYFARALTLPIIRLTTTAQKISAGDLTVNAPVSTDEIGTLANAFNIMTARLRQLINELEDRVRARTVELAERNESLTFRSKQLQTISEVARTIVSSSQGLETLLNDVTTLVSSRFGFYHTGIFLIDENREFAILRATNSEGGRRMLTRQHKLRVGQIGIVGYVTGNGKPRIATDVGQDAIFFNNPDLPLTRSEMALPLIGGGQVIGALDVQSTESNAFSQEDIELFATLADQIAIAILNSRSFEETQRALEESRLLHQQYLHQEWTREAKEKLHYTYEYTTRGVIARDRMVTPEISSVFQTGQAIIQNSSHQNEAAVMDIPITLRGETIGIIHLQDQSVEEREWAQEEIETVQSIADQVAQALENVRLFEQTVRRAERERKVLEITSKIRATTDPQTMLQIAVEELQRALRASKTQVILNRVTEPSASEKPTGNGHSPETSGAANSATA